MFKKILIANRGEIACRVAATARRLGVKTVAVYSDADTEAKHVEVCDEAVHIGGSAPKDSYLRWERILDAARSTGAEAVHPGYGFLSESEDFAQACADAGIAFIGPRPHSIRAMGLKAESKRLMEQAGVPLVPGYHGVDQDPALLAREADRIGYPVLIKASAGGGGKGMRVVECAEDFAAALASCQREAQSSFGSDAVLIEKYVQRPRHIEIQVFGDTQGQVVYLFERDCSVQRRHQKVLEEAPAPGMSETLRKQMGQAAVAAAQAVQYVGAGTVEFIVEQTAYEQPESMKFYFMEMNTRLQVEHPVTEAITGHDLVEWQLRVASGEPLPVRQEELRIHGHAIEARICAENPDKQFLPATGTLHVYRKPQSSSFAVSALRFDDGVREGDSISPFYDSMIAKLIVHGRSREEALNRLNAALAQTHIVGVQSNVQFLRHVIASPSFAQARLDTALIERESSRLFDQQTLAAERAAEAVVAQLMRDQRAVQATPGAWADPWAEVGGHGAFARSWTVQTGDETVIVREPVAALRKDAAVYAVPARPGHAQEDYVVFTPDGMRQVTVENPYAHAGDGEEASGTLTAPMPGKIISFSVQAGDTVTAGQTLAVMEAMKMEHTICAPRDGVVAELLYAAGDQVADGAELLKLEAAA